MAFFFPHATETRLLTLDEDQLFQKLKRHIKPVDREKLDLESADHLFIGTWSATGFCISLKLKIANNFVPLIHGDFVSGAEGILVRLRYGFFPATKKLLLFWTVLTLLITLFFIVVHQAWLYGAISAAFCVVNYILSRENFKIQVRKSKRMLQKMLGE
ncbi:MAG: hypothetical protein HC819_00120 [Cyclobacteriaceae bacterium]|nr:hypothetical protein [Cyclobacteriaceae bacterium]